MNKVFGEISSYAPVSVYGKRTTACYDYQEVGDGEHATWYEIYFTQSHNIYPNIESIKSAIIKDINDRTDYNILTGFEWNGTKVWLSEENQKNFSEAQRIAVMSNGANIPITFKLGEDENGNPVYHTFTTVEELTGFYLAAVAYIQRCLSEGWQKKDNIDLEPYKAIVGDTKENDVES